MHKTCNFRREARVHAHSALLPSDINGRGSLFLFFTTSKVAEHRKTIFLCSAAAPTLHFFLRALGKTPSKSRIKKKPPDGLIYRKKSRGHFHSLNRMVSSALAPSTASNDLTTDVSSWKKTVGEGHSGRVGGGGKKNTRLLRDAPRYSLLHAPIWRSGVERWSAHAHTKKAHRSSKKTPFPCMRFWRRATFSS